MTPLALFQIVALLLLGFGIIGLTRRRTLVGMLISVELMLNGAGLAIAAAGQVGGMDPALGQLTTLLIMGLAAAEATLILAVIVVVYRRIGSTRAAAITLLQE